MQRRSQGRDFAAGKFMNFGMGVLLLGFALVVYLPGFSAAFQYDDFAAIVNNHWIKIERLDLHRLLEAAFQDRLQNRPFSNLTFALNYYVGGLEPFGYHLVNFLALLFTALGIWILLQRLFIHAGCEPFRGRLAGWLAALVWTVHPVNVMAVTYITQRHTCFAGAFSVWSLVFFHLGAERRKPRWVFWSASGFCCLLALLSKETAVTLPALIFAYKIFFFDELKPGWVGRNWPWILVLAIFYLLAGSVALRPEMLKKMLGELSATPISPMQRILSVPRVLVWYPLLLLFPFPQFLTPLHTFYPSTSLLHPVTTAGAWLLLVFALLLALVKVRSFRFYSFAVFWYLGALLVEAMPLPLALANEHRLFLASLAVIVPTTAWPVLCLPRIQTAVSGILLVAIFFGFFSFSRNQVWHTQQTLWRDTVNKSPAFLWAWFHYCNALIESGECRSAVLACGLGTKAAADDYRPYLKLGICGLEKGMGEEAASNLLKALELNEALKSDGKWKAAISELTKLFSLQGRCEEAAALVRAASLQDPALERLINSCARPVRQ